MSKHRVVIAGGGFAGVKAALLLAENDRFHITLISDHADFRVYPTLFRVSTGGAKKLASIPLAELFKGKRVMVVNDTLSDLDRTNRTVKTKGGLSLPYEALIMALGVETNFFHIQGLDEFAYGVKSLGAAEKLKQHLHQQMIDENQPDLNYVVIGGGPTGVELAAALPPYIKKIAKQHGLKPRKIHVDLVEAAPRLLPRMPKDVSAIVARRLRKLGIRIYLKTAVQAQTADTLMANNKPIRSHTVIWTAGVMNHPFFAAHDFQLAKNGRVRVDHFLQAEAGIYVIGDNADTPYCGMAQTAVHDGKTVAENLIRLANNEEAEPYRAKRPIFVYPVGGRWAAVLWGPVRLFGVMGWMLRILADLLAFHDYEPWQLATKRWVAEAVEEDNCRVCAKTGGWSL